MTAEHDSTESQPQTAPSPATSLHQESIVSDQAPPATADAPAQSSRLSERIQIGSQRESEAAAPAPAPKPVTPGPANPDRVPEQKRKSYPPPNTRARLSPELEHEL